MKTGIARKTKIALLLLYMTASCLWAAGLSVSEIDLQAVIPVTESFVVKQNPEALDLNLTDSRNSSVLVGTYTLVSNNGVSLFRMYLSPGENGQDSVFAFYLDDADAPESSGATVLPFVVRVSSNNSGAVSISGRTKMGKDLGIRGILASNDGLVYESGEIIAEIPDFNPEEYSSGWYSAAIQVSIESI